MLKKLTVGILFFVSLCGLTLKAQNNAPEVVVEDISFSQIRVPNSSSGWYEMKIMLSAKAAESSAKFVDKVKVTASLGFEMSGPKPAAPFSFYQASTELPTVKNGRFFVYFYLPPEIVERDSIRGDAKYFLVELEVGGKPLQTSKNDVCRDLMKPELVASFKAKVASEASANAGIFVPQQLSPFAYDNQRQSPTPLRKESSPSGGR